MTRSSTTTKNINYDSNGNLSNGTDVPSITWSSYNKPTLLSKGSVSYDFEYGPDRRRYKKIQGTTVTHYAGGALERIVTGTAIDYRHMVRANGKVIMLHKISTSTGSKNEYIHRDHLGSVTALTKESDGTIIERSSYDAWGQRRSATDWTTAVTSAYEQRGYTGHEHLDDIGIIHMNGRVYDPKLGRMLSPDPVTQAPEDGQNYNRYTYAFNNPLRYTDPSGFKVVGKKTVCTDACISNEGAAGYGGFIEEVFVSAPRPKSITSNPAGLGNWISLTNNAQLAGSAQFNFYDQADALDLEQDIQNGTIVGQTLGGDLVDSEGNIIQQFDYFVGNYGEWGGNSLPPELGVLFADIRAVGFEASGILGLIGYTGGLGLYYDTETGEVGIFYTNGGGINAVDGMIVAGLEGSYSVTFTIAPDMESFSGDSTVSPGAHFGVVGYTYNFPDTGSYYGTGQIGPGIGSSVIKTNTDTIKLF